MVNRHDGRSNFEIERAEAEVVNRVYDTLKRLTEGSISRAWWSADKVFEKMVEQDPQTYGKLKFRQVESAVNTIYMMGLTRRFTQKIDHPWFKGEQVGYRIVEKRELSYNP